MNERNVTLALEVFMAASRLLMGIKRQQGLTNEQLADGAVARNMATREQADNFIAMLDALPPEEE